MKVLHGGKAIIVGLEPFNIEDYPDLRVIGCNMTSTEHLPVGTFKESSVQGVASVPEKIIRVISLKGETEFLQTVTSTAEHTIGLIIALLRNYKTALNGPYKGREIYKGHTLSGKNLGIIGAGRVGNQVRIIAQSLGMHVSSVDKGWEGNLPSLLGGSDIVTIHIPLSGNEDLFTRQMFRQMKPTAHLINTSRDGVIEKGALKWALENKIIAGAAVDFTDDEELVHYARDHDNLILTPHIGGCTYEDMERTEAFIEQKVNEYINKN